MTIPMAAVLPFTGVGLIYAAHVDMSKSTWLIVAIALYTIAFFFSLLVQLPIERRLVGLMRSAPPGPPPQGGPPPLVATLAKRLQLGGFLLTLMVVTILVLMVWKPGCQSAC